MESDKVLSCKEALSLLLDNVDFESGACRLTDMVGACIPKGVIPKCRTALKTNGTQNTSTNTQSTPCECCGLPLVLECKNPKCDLSPCV